MTVMRNFTRTERQQEKENGNMKIMQQEGLQLMDGNPE